jgi:ATP-dependent helicase/nuclease subunit A
VADLLTPQQEAEANQLAASNPRVSAFVAASAGSGKTRLLTDRILRLMVGGAPPERILCLTFTKAAAAEMALRLQRRLGLWVTLDEPALRDELRKLAIEPTQSTLHRARSLFAHVLDLPGGMRIGTIHAFCQSLLRRFPLEAEISPHFQLAENRDTDEAMTEAREDLLASVRPRGPSNALSDQEVALRTLAGVATLDRFSKLVTALKQNRERWSLARAAGPDLAAARRRILGVTSPDPDAVMADAVSSADETALRTAARLIAAQGAATVKEKANGILRWLALTTSERAANWATWRRFFLKSDGQPYAAQSMVNVALNRTQPDLLPPLMAEIDRVVAVEEQMCAAKTAALSDALCRLAGPLLDRYEDRKQSAGLLEFDDLIDLSTRLLREPGAEWVLYKLDGGLDHLLLDEVQDTAPEQWAIAHGLTREFFAGEGARDGVTRTVFAVGDRKQSIFSFQGADVAGFEDARGRLGARVTRASMAWIEKPLDISFRSTTPVLALVDAVFADLAAAAGVVLPGETLSHRAVREHHAGGVELWPLAEALPPETPIPWAAPERNQRATSAIQVLADGLAGWISDQIDGSVLLQSKGRPLRPGDIMILVRHRDALPAAVVRSLKSRGVPVAGLDRMVLTGQPAVQDLMVLGDALLLPQDDLSFASVLTSPLGGLDDNDLMALAIGRQQPLWETLRIRHVEAPHWARAWTFFSTLLNRIDYVSPHALYAEALGACGGRQRLLARLGAEAAEPIDELLSAALRYSKIHPPSLQGFLQWLRRSGSEIKREAEAAGNQVRILTVHGAKGLQAPLVILPDTTSMPREDDELLWADDPGGGSPVPIWVPRAEFHCDATRRLRDVMRQSRREEYNRLLYVALTRAEDRLVVCGAKPALGEPNEACWYSLIARGFAQLTELPDGDVARYDSPQRAACERELSAVAVAASVLAPAFVGTPPPPEPARPVPLAPSRPEGVEFGALPSGASPIAQVEQGVDRFNRGRLVHSLLQHLPDLPEVERRPAALRFLERSGNGVPVADMPGIADEVMEVLCHPALAPLFGPQSRAEVPLTGVVGNVVVVGLIDRMVVLPDRVLLADFKTNRRPPASIEATPVTYLRQMASYRAVLQTIFPHRPVQCTLIWTRESRISVLPDGLLDLHQPGRDIAATEAASLIC